ncbi:hypothetical protein EDB19DRAFT_1727147 [Suillus lakei]|nr:hypothetical protein EDB19DRAFT_1727147 [Suillus lakei]
MEPPTPITFRFSDLPTDLALLVFAFAAEPDLAQPYNYATKNPYSTALSLSRVSKLVRRVVLPRMLHTVLLPEPRQVTAFVQALRMQKTYIEQQQHDLSVDYASRVHRIWIGAFRGPLRDANGPFTSNFTGAAAEPGSELDVTLLAPLLLAVPSLAIDFLSLDVLLLCLKHACKSADVDLNAEHSNSVLPWKHKNVSLQWWPFLGNVYGYNFLASISHLTLLSSSSRELSRHFQGCCVTKVQERQDSEPYMVPLWMARAPFKRLETFSRVIPHIKLQVAQRITAPRAKETFVKLVTFPASLLPDHWTLEEIKTFMETEVGFIPIIPLPVSSTRKLCMVCLDCEMLWACGCEGPLPQEPVSD